MASLLDLYRSVFGGEADQGAPMAAQNTGGGFDPYRPPPPPDALELLKSATGYTDMQQAGQAYGRGEYLPALGQGAWGAAQAAATAFPGLKAGGAAIRAGAPLAREAAAAIPSMMADQGGAFRFGGTPIRAYHGSPHDFDQFDPRKIDSGWGEQSHGHGLYLTESEPLARWYRDRLSPTGSGRVYDANINASPEQLLNWDMPLSAQPGLSRAAQKLPGYAPEQTGGEFYDAVGKAFGINPAGTSRMFSKSGIPGVRYLDESVGEVAPGAQNYAIFDPKIIDIRRKYGLPLGIGAGGLGGLGGLGGQESYY